jgi:hypothetical protein
VSAACILCGSQERLRYDRNGERWVCVESCGADERSPAIGRLSRRRSPLFEGYLIAEGQRRRATRAEIAEAHRLYFIHADVREGRAHA